jgi:hypothetical protein
VLSTFSLAWLLYPGALNLDIPISSYHSHCHPPLHHPVEYKQHLSRLLVQNSLSSIRLRYSRRL